MGALIHQCRGSWWVIASMQPGKCSGRIPSWKKCRWGPNDYQSKYSYGPRNPQPAEKEETREERPQLFSSFFPLPPLVVKSKVASFFRWERPTESRGSAWRWRPRPLCGESRPEAIAIAGNWLVFMSLYLTLPSFNLWTLWFEWKYSSILFVPPLFVIHHISFFIFLHVWLLCLSIAWFIKEQKV